MLYPVTIEEMKRNLVLMLIILSAFLSSTTVLAETLSLGELVGDYSLIARKSVPNVPTEWQQSAFNESCFRLRKDTDGQLKVKIITLAPTAEVCTFSGSGELKQDVILVENKPEDPEEFCKLKIEIKKDQFLLREGIPKCEKWHCAKGNQFEGTAFSRGSKTSVNKSCDGN